MAKKEDPNDPKGLVDYHFEEKVASGHNSPYLEINEEKSSKDDQSEEVKEDSKKEEAITAEQPTKGIKITEDIILKSPNKHEFLFATTREKHMLDQLHQFFQINQETVALNAKTAAQNIKMAKYLAEALSNINSILETLAKIEKDNVEAERVRLRVLEVRSNNSNNTDSLEAKNLKRKMNDSEKEIIVIKNKKVKNTVELNVELNNKNHAENCNNLNKQTENRKEEAKAQSSGDMKESKCHRCNRYGHWMRECPLIAHNKWFCYVCQAIKGHKSVNCPILGRSNNDRYIDKNIRGKNFKQNDNFRGKEVRRNPSKASSSKVRQAKDKQDREN